MLAHCLALVDAAGPACVAVKPQLAFFERLGFAGWLALEATVAHAREQGLLVIADGKRGDIGSTAAGYAQAFLGDVPTPFGRSPGLGADALTRQPAARRATRSRRSPRPPRAAGAGLFVLVRTSNPGAADLFDLELAEGGPLWERLAAQVGRRGHAGPRERARRDRRRDRRHAARAPRAHARADAAHALPAPRRRGAGRERRPTSRPPSPPGAPAASSSASRSIADAHAGAGGAPAAAARAEAERLREQAWAL